MTVIYLDQSTCHFSLTTTVAIVVAFVQKKSILSTEMRLLLQLLSVFETRQKTWKLPYFKSMQRENENGGLLFLMHFSKVHCIDNVHKKFQKDSMSASLYIEVP